MNSMTVLVAGCGCSRILANDPTGAAPADAIWDCADADDPPEGLAVGDGEAPAVPLPDFGGMVSGADFPLPALRSPDPPPPAAAAVVDVPLALPDPPTPSTIEG